jgi:teichuronic acid biosynthesis glycosyltransferase TuaH
MVAGEWDGLVVVCGASWWGGTPLLEQHVAEELSSYAPVLYVDPPTSILTRFRSHEARTVASPPGLRWIHDRLCVLSVRVPPLMERRAVKPVSLWFMRRALRRAVGSLGAPDVRALVVPTLEPLFGCLDETYRVLYVKDDYRAGAELTGVPAERLRRLSEQLPRQADVVVAVSEVLTDRLRSEGLDPLFIPNGVDVAKFIAAGVPGDSAGEVVAFVGHLSDRVDVTLLQAVADSGVRLRMIGPPQETMTSGHLDGLRAHAMVEWAGKVPYDRLGAALADVTTCLLPYGDTEFNRASFPLKVLEYLAAGRRVVSTDLPAVRWLDTDLVECATSPADFTAAVRRSLLRPLDEEEVARRRDFARAHSWAARTALLAQQIGVPVHGPLPAAVSGQEAR